MAAELAPARLTEPHTITREHRDQLYQIIVTVANGTRRNRREASLELSERLLRAPCAAFDLIAILF